MVRLGTCRAPMVLAVVSAVWLPVMFFQLCDRLSHWGLNFHSAPSHQRLQLTMPAGLLTVRSFECRSRKPLGRVTCTEVFSAPIGWACAGSRATAAHSASSICPPALRQRLVGVRAWAWGAWAASVSNLSVMLWSFPHWHRRPMPGTKPHFLPFIRLGVLLLPPPNPPTPPGPLMPALRPPPPVPPPPPLPAPQVRLLDENQDVAEPQLDCVPLAQM